MNGTQFNRGLMIVIIVSLSALVLVSCKIPNFRSEAGNLTDKTGKAAFEPDSTNEPIDNVNSTDKIKMSDAILTHITADPNDERLTFQGRVISIDPSGQSFLVAVIKNDQQLLGDKAAVSLYADATVTRADTGEKLSLKNIPIDSEVTITITGGIRESYPVQVSAVSVVVTLMGS